MSQVSASACACHCVPPDCQWAPCQAGGPKSSPIAAGTRALRLNRDHPFSAISIMQPHLEIQCFVSSCVSNASSKSCLTSCIVASSTRALTKSSVTLPFSLHTARTHSSTTESLTSRDQPPGTEESFLQMTGACVRTVRGSTFVTSSRFFCSRLGYEWSTRTTAFSLCCISRSSFMSSTSTKTLPSLSLRPVYAWGMGSLKKSLWRSACLIPVATTMNVLRSTASTFVSFSTRTCR
mmetsp:Transcript_26706/g.84756  ORF Transcript_26706/g.84756 Transcript_26706/m.84756 type:complete len:236 (+) Transcript_26706:40-747(+)